MTYFFTADQHFNHSNIIKFCSRPYTCVEEMDESLINNHNEVVSPNDVVIHAGDFTLIKNQKKIHKNYIHRLNGQHVFLEGSHDYWLKNTSRKNIWGKEFDNDTYIVVCHYAMRVWHRSHFNSWQLFGHSHGNLPPIGKQHDIGVDNNNFYPVSFEEIAEIMKHREDNPNKIEK